MNTRSIRFQLVVWYTALLGAVFALFAVMVYAALHHFLEDSLRRSLNRYATQVATSIIAEKDEIDRNWCQEELSSHYAPETTARFLRLSLAPNNVLYTSGRPHDGSFEPSQIPQVPVSGRETFRHVTSTDGRRVLIKEMPVNKRGKQFLIEAGAPTQQIEAVANQMLLWLGVSMPVLFASAAVGAYTLVGRALQPVDKITRSAERITLQNLDERLPVSKTGDELESLSVALNGMITRLNDAYDYTRRFLADASHELRTPLTILRGELEHVLNTQPLSMEVKATLASNLEEVERLAKIVEGLFALSRLDAGEAQAESVAFDLTALTRTTTEQMYLLAEDKGVALECEGKEEVSVMGDRARLKQVIVNLVDNAIKYTPSRGRVQVRTFISGGNAILEVSDNGIGIPRTALPHVFERFYRVDKGRSRDLGGAGLGLSIVKSICAAHRATVEVHSIEGSGTTFRITLPLGPSISKDSSNEKAQGEEILVA